MTVTAYSYVRFSTPQQEQGDSYRRQTERAAAYCKYRGWTLDNSLKADRGVSAFKGKNALIGRLRAFLDRIAAGTVKPGSALIVESVDRISRQGIDEGYDLCKRILKAGIRLVTLCPEREYDVSATRKLTAGALELQLILERAAEESEMKADRSRVNWAAWRADTAAGRKTPPPGPLPAWIRWTGPLTADGKRIRTAGGTFEEIGPAGAAVKLIFKLAGEGAGLQRIAKRLNDSFFPLLLADPQAREEWRLSYVGKLLLNRQVLGELLAGARVYPDFYPAIVTPAEFYRARGALAGKWNRTPGNGAGCVPCLFTGLVFDAADGERMHLHTYGAGHKTLISVAAVRRKAHGRLPLPYRVFEAAFLKAVRELTPADLDGPGPDRERDRDTVLAGRQAELEVSVAKVKAKLAAAGSNVDALADMLIQWDAELKSIKAEREALTAKLTTDNGAALSDTQEVIDRLRAATGAERDDLRARLKAAVRRLVEGIWVKVFAVNSYTRAADVHVLYHGGAVRKLTLIWTHRGAYPGAAFGFGFDKRKPPHPFAAWPLSDYRTDPEVKEAFDKRHANPDLLDTLAELIGIEIETRRRYARADAEARAAWTAAGGAPSQVFDSLGEHLRNTLDGTRPPVRPGRPKKLKTA